MPRRPLRRPLALSKQRLQCLRLGSELQGGASRPSCLAVSRDSHAWEMHREGDTPDIISWRPIRSLTEGWTAAASAQSPEPVRDPPRGPPSWHLTLQLEAPKMAQGLLAQLVMEAWRGLECGLMGILSGRTKSTDKPSRAPAINPVTRSSLRLLSITKQPQVCKHIAARAASAL